MNKVWLLLLPLVLVGCSREAFWAQSEYVRLSDLASYRVGTPDPRKACPDTGQRIVVYWNLPDQFRCHDELWLILAMRFGNQEERLIKEPLNHHRNYFIYTLFNDEFFEKKGIQSFKAEVVADGHVVKEWVHQIWADVIEVGVEQHSDWNECECQ